MRTCLAALVLGLQGIGLAASTVVLETETFYDADTGSVQWSIRNSGDALADSLVVTACPFQGEAVSSEPVFVDAGDAVSGVLPAGAPPDRPGVYIVPLHIAYADSVGRTNETVSWARCFIGVDATAWASPLDAALAAPMPAAGEDPRLKQSRTLSLAVNSSVDESVDASLRMLLPAGFQLADDAPRTVSVPARGIVVVDIDIENRPLSPDGSATLPVAALLEFETADGFHHVVETFAQLDLQSDAPAAASDLPQRLPQEITWALAAIWLAASLRRLWGRGQPPGAAPEARGTVWAWCDAGLVAGLTLYLGWMLNAQLVWLDTLCVGGDTPAHHYLISHIRETGRIVSWAPGWWSGFPMFRFYFPLPYAAMALLSTVVPHNVAFKIGSIAGILALPACLYASGRILRLRRPAPAMLACLAVPLVLDNTHNMWGVNAYSTLAGMIANSWSFALLAPAMAMALRDALEGRCRVRTALMLAAVVLSHFFTSMMAALVLAFVLLSFAAAPELRRSGLPLMRRPWAVLAAEGTGALLLTAWWVVPLYAERAWSVDFGGRWDIRFFRQLPPLATWPLLAALGAGLVAVVAVRVREPASSGWRGDAHWFFAHLGLLGFSLLFFFVGGAFSDVFVNCRFWPFIVYSLLVVGALAFAHASRIAGLQALGVVVCLCACLSFAWQTEGHEDNPAWSCANHVRHWARYNFEGLDGIREGDVVGRIVDRVRGTGGRLSQDMHPGHEALGSSRVFEAMPHLCGKPILEGGIVNSALGSLAAYTIQCEISEHPAGWPLLVKPQPFNPASGMRHLEFMNVRHFVARGRRVQEAFDADAGWTRIGAFGGGKWKLYESRLGSASPVRVWKTPLPVFESTHVQRDLLEWMYTPAAVETPAVLAGQGTPAPPGVAVQTHADYVAWLASLTNGPPAAGWLDTCSTPCDDVEKLPDGGIRFRTDSPGLPHVIAISYAPNWRARGADAVYFLTPGHLAVYPVGNEVELVYDDGVVVVVSRVVSIAMVVALGSFATKRWIRNSSSGEKA
ncbi:MAG: hypothetical protein ACOX9C_01265 [Kiritimatiellia bacterium]|jgi:hypothetical protein